MNFDDLKDKMDSENMDDFKIPKRIKAVEKSKMPIQKVRKTMKGEILTQLICIVVFFTAPSFVEMHQLPKGMYYILMFVTSLITIGYLIKMGWFLHKTNNLNEGSKETVLSFINDLRLTLEVYKTAIIAGSLLLPLSILTFLLGIEQFDQTLFTNLILLNMPTHMLIIGAIAYIILAILIYFGTLSWSNSLYGANIEQLEKTLKEFYI